MKLLILWTISHLTALVHSKAEPNPLPAPEPFPSPDPIPQRRNRGGGGHNGGGHNGGGHNGGGRRGGGPHGGNRGGGGGAAVGAAAAGAVIPIVAGAIILGLANAANAPKGGLQDCRCPGSQLSTLTCRGTRVRNQDAFGKSIVFQLT
jgi:hypothetical protein